MKDTLDGHSSDNEEFMNFQNLTTYLITLLVTMAASELTRIRAYTIKRKPSCA